VQGLLEEIRAALFLFGANEVSTESGSDRVVRLIASSMFVSIANDPVATRSRY
jgi:hypothetical protein